MSHYLAPERRETCPIFAAGWATHAAGKPREVNPVPYVALCELRITAEQAAKRQAWFDGWDAAEEHTH